MLPAMTNPVCFEVPSTYEITVNGKKLIGSAQARKQEGVLQHGSLPLIGDLTRICQALVFKDEAAREVAAQRLLTRATTVQSVIGVETDWETAAQAFVHGFEAQLGIHFQRGEMSRSESERAEEFVKEKYAHPSWTETIMKNFLIYGSYGYTGSLIVEQAVKEGLKPLLAGRDEKLLRAQAEKFGLEYRAFSIEDSCRA